ncbi:MAG: ArsA family ATPase [Deltaproteobacteria bacterium]|nr:ArsA family ATPase [Deltaproteobacteria bacterium]
MSTLLDKKLLIVSGKGGVGKTTVASALAVFLARQKKRVLLAEIQSQGQVAGLFGHSSIDSEETPLLPNLWAINICPKKAFEEYVLKQIKYHALYTAVFENRFVRYFLEATPGLSELMCIGKVYSLLSQYDCVVVDAPATGHGISLLQIPGIIASAVRVGPLKENAEKIERLLKDEKTTALCLVSLPEEMPVNETVEMFEKAGSELKVPLGPVFINQILSPLFKGEEVALFRKWRKEALPLFDPLIQAAILREAQGDRVAFYQKQLRQRLPKATFLEVPFLFSESFGLKELKKISHLLDEENL